MFATLRSQVQMPGSLAIICLGVLWGASFPAIDIVVGQLPPLGAAGIRYAISGCIILGYAAATTERLFPRTRRGVLSIITVGGFMFGGYQAGLYLGTQYVSGAVASVVITMSPVAAALIAVPVLGESRGLLDGCGFLFGLAGVVILAQPSFGSDSLTSTGIGIGLVFLGTVLFALGSVTVQLFDDGLPTEALQGWAMLLGAGVLFCGGIIRGEAIPAMESLSPDVVGALLYITFISGAGGYLLYFRLVRHIGATETSLVAYIEPLSATLVSVLLLGHTVAGVTIIGFIAIAAGFSLVSRDTLRQTINDIRTADPTSSSTSQRREG